MRTIDSIQSNEVVHCPTKEQAIKFCQLLHNNGKEWNSETSYLYDNKWDRYKNETCYEVYKGYFGQISHYMNMVNYKILSCDEFFPEEFGPVWSWCKIDKPGLWAYSNCAKTAQPVIFSVKYHSTSDSCGNPCWRAYLGPLPEIKTPKIEYVRLKFNDIDHSDFPEKIYIKEGDSYIERTLEGICLKRNGLIDFILDHGTIAHVIYARKQA